MGVSERRALRVFTPMEIGVKTSVRLRRKIPAVTIAMASVVCALPAEVLAQDGQAPAAIAQATEARTFDIPPQPLAAALGIFGQQSGRQITVDGALVRNINTPGVQGSMVIGAALDRLLSGTGLTYSLPSRTTISIHRLAGAGDQGALQLDPVRVQAATPPQALIDNVPPPYAGGQVATGSQLGLLGNRDVMDTPFNQISYTARKAQDQQARTVRDVLVDDPSIRPLWPTGGSLDETVWIRGFSVSSLDTAFNGLYGILPVASVPAEIAERVEVLKGPSAMLNGMPPGGGIGGTINVVPKRAGSEPLNQATAGYGYSGQFSGHVDFGRRFAPDESIGLRFNGVFRAGNTAVDRNTEQVGVGSLGLDFRGERVRLSADLGFQLQYIGGLVSFVAPDVGVAVPAAPRNSSNFGQTWTDTAKRDLFAVVRGEIDVTESITAYAAFGVHDNRVMSFAGGSPVATSADGTIVQSPFRQAVYNTFLTGEAGVRALFDTGRSATSSPSAPRPCSRRQARARSTARPLPRTSIRPT